MIARALLIAVLLGAILAAAPNSAVDGATPLHNAAYQDDIESARKLLAGGASPNVTNRYGVTPLSLACVNGNAAMVKLLIDAGAKVNEPLPGGETPLMTAARSGNAATVKALIAAGAEVNAKEPARGQTAIMWAAAEGNTAVVELLVEFGAKFKDRLDSGYTPFLFAVREGKIDTVKALLKAGADVNETTPGATSGRRSQSRGGPRASTSALTLAVLNGHFELASYLLDAGADPNADGPGYTPLHVLTWVRKPGGGDNDPAPIGSGSMTSIEIARKLVAKGANVNARMTKKVDVGLTRLQTLGATPFLLAARTADSEYMRVLAELGADPKINNEENSTPLMAAAGLGTRSPGEDAGTEDEVVEAIKVALELGNDIDAVDKNGETAMHGAAYKNLPGAVRILAQRGAKVEIWNKANKLGWSPLTIAEGYRFGNFKPSAVTIAALHEVMKAAGVPLTYPRGSQPKTY